MLIDPMFPTVMRSKLHFFHLGNVEVLSRGHWIAMICQFSARWQFHPILLKFPPMMRTKDCTLLETSKFSTGHPLDRTGPEPELLKSTEKWKIGIQTIEWERKVINLKYQKLVESRKKQKWLIIIFAIDNKRCEILQNRGPRGLEEVCDSK